MAHDETGRASATAALALLAACSSAPNAALGPEFVYLFDCGGWIQPIDERGAAGSALRVSEIDERLPPQVRDGCAIQEGHFDRDGGALELVVQTAAIQHVQDDLRTRTLRLSTPGLALDDVGPAESRWSPPAAARDPPSIPDTTDAAGDPFGRSAGYSFGNGTLVLLQELGPNAASPTSGLTLDRLWELGRVSLRSTREEASGRYALMDVAAGSMVGGVVSGTVDGAPGRHRVVCFTPGGRIFLATARDALLILDVHDPTSRRVLDQLPLDLFWTACAVG